LRGLFEEAVLSRDDVMGLAIDRRSLRKLYQQHLSGSHDFAWGLWPILSLALWEQHHFAGRQRGRIANEGTALRKVGGGER
jgi:hypothetical protein